jgi:uncharacterized protein (DUF1501 family)
MAGGVRVALADAPGEKRFVVVMLRGALDGMSAVVPYGDANLASLRAPLVPPAPGQTGGVYDLGGFYGLHPALSGMYGMYQAGELLPIHAVAGPYRTRSHFDAQDLLQIGTDEAGVTSGWLNRALAELPLRNGNSLRGVAAGLGTPLLMQGKVPVGSYAVGGFAPAPPDIYAQVQALNATDRLLGPAIAEGLREDAYDTSVLSDDTTAAPGDAPHARGGFPVLAAKIGTLLAAQDGPRVAAFQLEGWDTHGNQLGGLKNPLSGLDAGLVALKTALGPAWSSTAVLVMTEFGRTAAMNGTKGTDHGTATASFILGGVVQGGRVLGTWPGLAPGQLFEARDLAPTTDIRAVAMGALAGHLGLGAAALGRVFPGSGGVSPLQGIVKI